MKEGINDQPTQGQMDEGSLTSLLAESGISTTEWGKGNAKTIHHLLKEIKSGETILEKTESGELIRNTSFLTIDVYYEDSSGKYKLVEEKQVFADGRIRNRGKKWGVAEKIKAGEVDIRDAAKRAIAEELGIEGETDWDEEVKHKEEITDSPSYPGLKARFKTYALKVKINDSQYKAEGYEEVQEDKTTYFRWEKVT